MSNSITPFLASSVFESKVKLKFMFYWLESLFCFNLLLWFCYSIIGAALFCQFTFNSSY